MPDRSVHAVLRCVTCCVLLVATAGAASGSSREAPARSSPVPAPALAQSESGQGPGSVTLPPRPEPPRLDEEDRRTVKLAFDPSRIEVRAGDRFSLHLYARGALGIVSLPLTLEYDPSIVTVESVGLADESLGTIEPTLLQDTSRPGRVVVGLSHLGAGAAFDARQNLLRIDLVAVAEGTTPMRIRRHSAIEAGLVSRPTKARTARLVVGE